MRKRGITMFSTPFDETAVDLLESLNTPAYKIASFEVVQLQLIRYVAGTRKPMIISTGMASEDEINEAVTTAREAGCKDLVLLHCSQLGLWIKPTCAILNLPNGSVFWRACRTTLWAPIASIAAIALGACLIEKHFTLSRKDKGPDGEFSLEPAELERLCSDTHDAWLALGRAGFERQRAEES